MRISDWSSDVCSSDPGAVGGGARAGAAVPERDFPRRRRTMAARAASASARSRQLHPPAARAAGRQRPDRKGGGQGKRVHVRFDIVGRRFIKKKNSIDKYNIFLHTSKYLYIQNT